jgi:hypothetical protein
VFARSVVVGQGYCARMQTSSDDAGAVPVEPTPAAQLTGRCLCGSVTYELTGAPFATVVCHCDHCQRQSGGAFSVNLLALGEQLDIAGELQTYEETDEQGDTVYVRRRFCGSCGSPIVSELVQAGGTVAVKAGSLDDRSTVLPTVEVWCVDRQPWVSLPGMAVSLERESM